MRLRSINPVLGWGIAGFGLAHIVLGSIDLAQSRHQSNDIVKIGANSTIKS
ncbi:hypothetical protein [Orenia marismortui]|uniref:Asparagine synthase n=1 Tax=Orenia marismortui TaxID=46469 RepID=A0A4R8GWV9_9FIRM|nr:hypothetical protein [Orenia marismortui]TDX46457.1 hypothetical protein C7959_14116 [Orenia marismortui]